jgi:hypothetical protein
MDQSIDMNVQVSQDDPWKLADEAKPRDFEYFGQMMADVWFGFFPGGGQKPIAFDPAQHPIDKRTVMIDIQIIPIAAQNVDFDIRKNYTDFSTDWTKITLPSIKALGVDGLRALNGKFVRVAQVPGKREKKDENGNKTGEFYTTFKFLEIYADEAACVTAYEGNSSHTEQNDPQPVTTGISADQQTALKFSRAVIENTVKGETDLDVIINKLTATLAAMPMINKHYSAQSPEIMQMVMEAMQK